MNAKNVAQWFTDNYDSWRDFVEQLAPQVSSDDLEYLGGLLSDAGYDKWQRETDQLDDEA